MELEELVSPEPSFFARPTVEVARALLGSYLLSEIGGCITGGRIVETEAYLTDDPASHSYRGERPRNRSMFHAPGTLYVYLIYGVHYCLNVVTAPPGVGEAVLLRSLEPVWGVEVMARRRRREWDVASARDGVRAEGPPAQPRERGKLTGISDGPGKIATALAVTLGEDGSSLLTGPVRLLLPGPRGGRGEHQPLADERIVATGRIGISTAGDRLLRFVDSKSELLSRRLGKEG
ncbi:MAG: DNA-3-methyladenine glycosylase [Alkalispirochaetaceae bacterium]